jgi:hypothetical protein
MMINKDDYRTDCFSAQQVAKQVYLPLRNVAIGT